jgi:KUP system potassium uptake protein
MTTDALGPVHGTTHSRPPVRAAAILGALGVVFGDIGTSPLYALKEAASAAGHDGALTPETWASCP